MAEQWIYGVHAVQAILNNPLRKIYYLYISDNRQDERIQQIERLAKQRTIEIRNLQSLGKKFADKVHQGVIAQVEALADFEEGDIPWLLDKAKSQPFILILDGVTDVHNLGACLRSADGAGVDFVILLKDKSAPVNDVVSKVACGAAESVPIVRVVNLARTLRKLKEAGVWIYGAAGETLQTLYQLDCQRPLALVMGAEDKGLRRLTREHCDALFSIPMRGVVESLNVSVAAGISLFEVNRQRL